MVFASVNFASFFDIGGLPDSVSFTSSVAFGTAEGRWGAHAALGHGLDAWQVDLVGGFEIRRRQAGFGRERHWIEMTTQHRWVFPFGLCKRVAAASDFEYQRVLVSRPTSALISIAHAKRFEPHLAVTPTLQGDLDVEQAVGRIAGVLRLVKIEMCDACVTRRAEFG